MGRFAVFVIATTIAGNVCLTRNAPDNLHMSEALAKVDRKLCLKALQPLKFVSDTGKITPRYLLTAGRANDCGANGRRRLTALENTLVFETEDQVVYS